MIRPGLVRDLKPFMGSWDRNIADQGFALAYAA